MEFTLKLNRSNHTQFQAAAAFAHTQLEDAILHFLSGELSTARVFLRDLVNATIGFKQIAQQIEKSPQSLQRM